MLGECETGEVVYNNDPAGNGIRSLTMSPLFSLFAVQEGQRSMRSYEDLWWYGLLRHAHQMPGVKRSKQQQPGIPNVRKGWI